MNFKGHERDCSLIFCTLSLNLPGVSKKTMKIIKIVGVPDQIQTNHLENTSQKHYHLNQLDQHKNMDQTTSKFHYNFIYADVA
jgi:hypothetical protein